MFAFWIAGAALSAAAGWLLLRGARAGSRRAHRITSHQVTRPNGASRPSARDQAQGWCPANDTSTRPSDTGRLASTACFTRGWCRSSASSANRHISARCQAYAVAVTTPHSGQGTGTSGQTRCVGGAITNLLNAAHLLGFAGKMLSGNKVRHGAIQAAFCAPGETLLGWISLGTATRALDRVVRGVELDGVLQPWSAAAAQRRVL